MITLNVWTFKAEDKEYLSMLYRVTDHIDEANGVLKPFKDARSEIAQKELDSFEMMLDEADKKACEQVEGHPHALQEWEAKKESTGLIAMFFKGLPEKPERPTEDQVKAYKRVTDRRSELRNRVANPLMDIEKGEGEGIIRSLLEGWEAAGFKKTKQEEESNGEYRKRVIELTYGDAPAQ